MIFFLLRIRTLIHFVSATLVRVALPIIIVKNAFKDRLIGESFVLMSNSSTDMASLKKQGVTMSLSLCWLAQEVIEWLGIHGISISTKHIPGEKNILADRLSRPNDIIPTEWSLPP